jgi:hypothetical protein
MAIGTGWRSVRDGDRVVDYASRFPPYGLGFVVDYASRFPPYGLGFVMDYASLIYVY